MFTICLYRWHCRSPPNALHKCRLLHDHTMIATFRSNLSRSRTTFVQYLKFKDLFTPSESEGETKNWQRTIGRNQRKNSNYEKKFAFGLKEKIWSFKKKILFRVHFRSVWTDPKAMDTLEILAGRAFHFCLTRKELYNRCLWEFFFSWSLLKILPELQWSFLRDNNYEPFKKTCSFCWVSNSGGSRISPRWGRLTLRGVDNTTILPNVPKNCMELKALELQVTGGGGGEVPFAPILESVKGF